MITIFIGLLGALLLYAMASEGNWGAFGLCAFVLLFLWLCAHEERKDWEAYRNFRNYWLGKGKSPEEMREDNKRLERSIAAARERGNQKKFNELMAKYKWCPKCTNIMLKSENKVMRDGNEMTEYYCKRCGTKILVKE